MFSALLDQVRAKAPLIHCITNYVTVNDCANMLLAAGGSPIMADDPEEAAEITAVCGGLTLNIGTLNRRTIPAMRLAGRRAAELGKPIVLDPVGAGASALRTATAKALLEELPVTVVRGNISEIKALAAGSGTTQGVDANVADAVTEENLDASAAFVRDFAARFGTVAAVTGAIDLVSDGERTFVIRNGSPLMSRITGTGCMLSVLTAAFVAANPGQALEAAAAAVCAMGLCGETGAARMGPQDGNAALRGYIIDAVYCLTGEKLDQGARYVLG